MQVFRFKPALLRSAISFRLSAGTLVQIEDDGSLRWSLDLTRINRADFVEQRVNGVLMRRIDLQGPEGRHQIGVTVDGPEGSSEAAKVHLDLVEAICADIAADQPAFPIGIGEYGKARLAMFLIGVLSLSAALALGVAMGVSGVSASRAAAAALPMLLLSVLGGAVSWAYAPWHPPQRLPARVMGDLVQGLRDRASGQSIGPDTDG